MFRNICHIVNSVKKNFNSNDLSLMHVVKFHVVINGLTPLGNLFQVSSLNRSFDVCVSFVYDHDRFSVRLQKQNYV